MVRRVIACRVSGVSVHEVISPQLWSAHEPSDHHPVLGKVIVPGHEDVINSPLLPSLSLNVFKSSKRQMLFLLRNSVDRIISQLCHSIQINKPRVHNLGNGLIEWFFIEAASDEYGDVLEYSTVVVSDHLGLSQTCHCVFSLCFQMGQAEYEFKIRIRLEAKYAMHVELWFSLLEEAVF